MFVNEFAEIRNDEEYEGRAVRSARTTQAALLAVGLTLSSWGCAETTTPPGSPASVWKGPAQLQEVGRIGAEPGVPEQMLGSVRSVWGTATETYIVDNGEPRSVRVYTSAGDYLRSIGRRGEGPGEYRSPSAVAVGPDGNVFVLDIEGDGLVLVYGPNGQYLHGWKYPASGVHSRPFLVDGAGDIYASTRESVPVPTGSPELQLGFTRISADGTVDDSVIRVLKNGRDKRFSLPNSANCRAELAGWTTRVGAGAPLAAGMRAIGGCLVTAPPPNCVF